MSPEHALRPSPPVAGWSPASTGAFPVSILQITPSPSRPSARSVISAVSGCCRYRSLRGACKDLSSSAFICSFVRAAAVGLDRRYATHETHLLHGSVPEDEGTCEIGSKRKQRNVPCSV